MPILESQQVIFHLAAVGHGEVVTKITAPRDVVVANLVSHTGISERDAKKSVEVAIETGAVVCEGDNIATFPPRRRIDLRHEFRQLADMVHQAYHQDMSCGSGECDRGVCGRVRSILHDL